MIQHLQEPAVLDLIDGYGVLMYERAEQISKREWFNPTQVKREILNDPLREYCIKQIVKLKYIGRVQIIVSKDND